MLVRMHYAPTAYLWWSRAMLAPDQMVWRIPHWMRALLVGCFVVLVTGAGLFAYHYFTSPKTITIAAGSSDGEAVRLMSAIAVQLTKTGARIRLKITDSGSTLGAAQAFSAGKGRPRDCPRRCGRFVGGAHRRARHLWCRDDPGAARLFGQGYRGPHGQDSRGRRRRNESPLRRGAHARI